MTGLLGYGQNLFGLPGRKADLCAARFICCVGQHGDSHTSGSCLAKPRREVIPLHGDRDDLLGGPVCRGIEVDLPRPSFSRKVA